MSPVLAALVTVVLPGLGHGIAGYGRRGAAWVAAILAVLALGVLLASRTLWGVAATGVLPVVVIVAAAVDAARVASRGRGPGGGWVAWGGAIAFLVFVAPIATALGLRTASLESFRLPSGSMCPTLRVGDLIFADKTAYRSASPAAGDLVVHTDPHDPDKDFIRRVVAVGGEVVSIAGNELRVGDHVVPTRAEDAVDCDGALMFEETLGTTHRIAHAPDSFRMDRSWRVPAGELFLLGDNRDNSHDSRYIGPIPARLVKGRVFRVWQRDGALTWLQVR